MTPSADSTLTALLAQMSWARALARDLVRDRDRADELVQEVWVKALENPPRHADSLKGWISRVMRNRIHEERRNDARRRELPAPAAAAAVETPAETLERLETVQLLGQIVRRLPEPYQAAILLRYFESCSMKEVAQRLRIPEDAAEKRVRRGRELIEAQLRARDDAKRWAHGLMLLAAPYWVPTTSLALKGAAAVLLLGFVLVPVASALGWFRGSEAAPVARSSGDDAADRLPPPATGTMASMTGLATAPERATVSASRTLEVVTRDFESMATIGGLLVTADFLDARGAVLGTQSWTTDAEEAHGLRLPEGAASIAWSIEPGERFTDGGGARVLPLEDEFVQRSLEIPVWKLAGALSGRVVDAGGLPVPNATVELWFSGGELRAAAPSLSVPADRAGIFHIGAAFASGRRAFVAARAPGYSALRCLTVEPVRAEEANIAGIELALEAGVSQRVRVEGVDGQPVVGARVWLRPNLHEAARLAAPGGWLIGRRSYQLLTDATGTSAAVAVGRSEWQIEVACPGFAPWRGAPELVGEETRVVLAAASRLHGVVLSAEQRPAHGVRVIAEGVGGSTETRTSATGEFEMARPGWPDAPVRLVLLPEDPALATSVSDAFVPERDGFARIEVLAPGAALAVELVAADGTPWRGERVEHRLQSPRHGRVPGKEQDETWLETRDRLEPGRGWSGAPGARVALAGLGDEPVQVSFWSERGLLAEQIVHPGAGPVTLRAGEYPEARAALSGVVRRAGADASPSASVLVHAQRLKSGDPFEFDGAPIEVSTHGEHGHFELLGLLPGRWNVQVYDPEDASVWHAEAIAIAAGERRTLAAVLEDAHGGLLRLVHADGAPAARARVRLLRDDGAHQPLAPGLLAATTDDDGRIALARLPRGAALRIAVVTREGAEWLLPAEPLTPPGGPWQRTLVE
jgi:RNA polymerase sigma factor (sigma-70 family)